MKKRAKSGAAGKVARAHESFDADVSEAFRRARSQVAEIRTDLDKLRRRATGAVKPPRRSAKRSE